MNEYFKELDEWHYIVDVATLEHLYEKYINVSGGNVKKIKEIKTQKTVDLFTRLEISHLGRVTTTLPNVPF